MHTWLQSEEADAAEVRSWRLDDESIDLHLSIVKDMHRWKRGEIGAAEAVTTILSAVEAKPRVHLLNTATAWYRGFASEDPAFASLLDCLSSSRHALARVHAAFHMRDDPVGHLDRARFERLIADKSKAVRQQIVHSAFMCRWYAALPALRERREVESDPSVRELIESATTMIPSGFDLKGDFANVYLGQKPGGAGAIGGVSLSDAPITFLEELGRRELSYRLATGHWPARPQRHYEIQDLLS